MNKRGVYFFIIDVVIGILIFLTTVLIISSFFTPKSSLFGMDQNLDILTDDFFTLPATHYKDNPLFDSVPPELVRDDVIIDELIYAFINQYPPSDTYHRALNNATIGSIIKDMISWLPLQYGFQYAIDDKSTLLYSRNTSLGVSLSNSEVAVSRAAVTQGDMAFGVSVPTVTRLTIWR